MKLKHPWCSCPTHSTLKRAVQLHKRTYWRSFFSRRSRTMLGRIQLSIRRMLIRRYGCAHHEPDLRRIYEQAGRNPSTP